ncbi:hypothetical protein R6Q57_028748 [Mikania cordata]
MRILFLFLFLQHAAGRSVYELLKLFPIFPSPPANTFLKTDMRVIGASETYKRKADTEEELEQQPSPKKLITDGPVVVSPSNNTTTKRDETGANIGDPEPETSSAHMQIADDVVKDNNNNT